MKEKPKKRRAKYEEPGSTSPSRKLNQTNHNDMTSDNMMKAYSGDDMDKVKKSMDTDDEDMVRPDSNLGMSKATKGLQLPD